MNPSTAVATPTTTSGQRRHKATDAPALTSSAYPNASRWRWSLAGGMCALTATNIPASTAPAATSTAQIRNTAPRRGPSASSRTTMGTLRRQRRARGRPVSQPPATRRDVRAPGSTSGVARDLRIKTPSVGGGLCPMIHLPSGMRWPRCMRPMPGCGRRWRPRTSRLRRHHGLREGVTCVAEIVEVRALGDLGVICLLADQIAGERGLAVAGLLGVRGRAMQCDAEYDQGDACQVTGGWDLAEDDQADDGRRGGQQGEHEGEGGAGQPGHRELVGDVGDDGGADADADAP